MQALTKQVFSEKQIVTTSLAAKDLRCTIDEANKLMYEFYQKNRENIETYFIIVRKEGTTKIVIDRLPEHKLNYNLYDSEYNNSIISLKIWAVYDKSQGELDVTDIYEVEDADLHCIQNLCHNMRDLDLKRAEYQAKRAPTATPAKSSSQTSAKKAQPSNTTEKPKATVPTSTKESQENTKKQPNVLELAKPTKTNDKNTKAIEEEAPAKVENPPAVKENPKKRKGETIAPIVESLGQDKELKKAKMTNRMNSFEQKEPAKKEEPPKKELKQQKSSKIELEDEEESYYPDEPGTTKIQDKKLKSSDSFESPSEPQPQPKTQPKAQPKTLKSQNSFKKQESKEFIEEPAPVASLTSQKSKEFRKAPSKDDVTQESEEHIQVKRIRKVPKEKTYMDEKGYLIVENEMVEEEYWETVKAKPAGQTNHNNSNANASKTKAPEKNQATLSSFFRKK